MVRPLARDVVLLLAGLALAIPAAAAPADDRAQRVERGLLPTIVVRGEALPHYSIWQEMSRRNVPGVSVAVIDGGRIAWARAYGVTEAGGRDSVTTGTLFQAGSVSKPVAAMTALHLVEGGRLRLDEDVNRSLRSWKVPPSDSAAGVAITLRMLLTHSAGLTVHGFPGYAAGDSMPTLVQVLDGVRPANTPPIRVNARPGRAFDYSGGGFTVAQQLLIDVTGEPFERLAERAVLRPAAMTHSTFDQPAAPVPGVPRASGHDRKGATVPGKWNRYPELAAAGLWTTPADLGKLVLEVQSSYRGSSRRILSQATTRAMLSPAITPTQGLGWRLDGRSPPRRFEHQGDTKGFACTVVGYLDRGQGAVVMTNSERGGTLASEILRGISQEYGWPDDRPVERQVAAVPAADLGRLVGRYVLDVAPNVSVEISTGGDSLYATIVQPSGSERVSVLPESPLRFFERDSGLEFWFVPESEGGPFHLVIHQGEEEYRATLAR